MSVFCWDQGSCPDTFRSRVQAWGWVWSQGCNRPAPLGEGLVQVPERRRLAKPRRRQREGGVGLSSFPPCAEGAVLSQALGLGQDQCWVAVEQAAMEQGWGTELHPASLPAARAALAGSRRQRDGTGSGEVGSPNPQERCVGWEHCGDRHGDFESTPHPGGMLPDRSVVPVSIALSALGRGGA